VSVFVSTFNKNKQVSSLQYLMVLEPAFTPVMSVSSCDCRTWQWKHSWYDNYVTV